jgi:antitoxin ParD1/3/4
VKLVSVFLTEGALNCMDELIRKGMYASRSATVRTAVNDLIQRELTVEERHKLLSWRAVTK